MTPQAKWDRYAKVALADSCYESDLSFTLPPQSDWYSFETAAGRRTKPHMVQEWNDGGDMVFACGVRTDARRPTCAEPVLPGVPEFGLPPAWPLRPDIEHHEQVLEPGAAVRLPPGACALCAHEKEREERAWYDAQAAAHTQLHTYLRVTRLGHAKLSGLL